MNFQSWDTNWELKKALLGGVSVVPSVNLVAHIGFGPDATHNAFVRDIWRVDTRWHCPVRRRGRPSRRGSDDSTVGPLLFELMATYRGPDCRLALARSAQLANGKVLVRRPAATPSFGAVSQCA